MMQNNIFKFKYITKNNKYNIYVIADVLCDVLKCNILVLYVPDNNYYIETNNIYIASYNWEGQWRIIYSKLGENNNITKYMNLIRNENELFIENIY